MGTCGAASRSHDLWVDQLPRLAFLSLTQRSTLLSADLGSPVNMDRFTSEQCCFVELGKIAEALRKMYFL